MCGAGGGAGVCVCVSRGGGGGGGGGSQGFGRQMLLNSVNLDSHFFTYIHCLKSVQEIQENTDQKNFVFGHFSRSDF